MGEQLYRKTGESTPDKLIADVSIPVTAIGIRVAKGEGVLKRGTLLGIAADGTHKRTDTEEGAGTGDGDSAAIGADCILTDDVDATDREVVTTGYVTGRFNSAAVIVPEGKTVSAHEATLRQLGIFLRSVQEY